MQSLLPVRRTPAMFKKNMNMDGVEDPDSSERSRAAIFRVPCLESLTVTHDRNDRKTPDPALICGLHTVRPHLSSFLEARDEGG